MSVLFLLEKSTIFFTFWAKYENLNIQLAAQVWLSKNILQGEFCRYVYPDPYGHCGGKRSNLRQTKSAKTVLPRIRFHVGTGYYGSHDSTSYVAFFQQAFPLFPALKQWVDSWHPLEARAKLAVKCTVGGNRPGWACAPVSMLHVLHVTIPLSLSLASSAEGSGCDSHLNAIILENSLAGLTFCS